MVRARAEEECRTMGEAYDEGYAQGKADVIDEVTEKYFDAIEDTLHQTDLKLGINQALSIYARIMNRFYEIAEQYKEQNNE